jgi:hypothetical protein
MRMFLSVHVPNGPGNEAIKSGAMPRLMGKFIETFKPEAAYFITKDGDRCAHFYIDMKDVSQMTAIAEPFFIELGAKVTYCPAMTPDDLKKGLEAFAAAR